MFDYFQISGKIPNDQISFSSLPFYDRIISEEYKSDFGETTVRYLERTKTQKNKTEDENHCLFVYGTVYTNKKYEVEKGLKPKMIYADFLFKLYREFGIKLVNFIKGSFILIIIDKRSENTILITDRMNVLPLHFYHTNGYYIISSSIRHIFNTGLVSKELDPQSITEQLIFDYVLENKTYFREVKQTMPGAIHYFDKKEVRIEKYWNIEDLYSEKLLPEKESLDRLTSLQFENVNLYASDAKKVLVSFTGGFDGRTNVALLDRPKEDLVCYSFGRPGSKSIIIPEYISEKLGYQYTPIILDKNFEEKYNDLSKEITEFSNGTAPLIRANYVHAFKSLREQSTILISGVFGSEILRPIHNLGIMMNNHSERLFLSGMPVEDSLGMSVDEVKSKKYIDNEIVDQGYEEIVNYFNRFNDRYSAYNNVTKLFFFLLEEGIRKYFMQEIQHERGYITNRFPYFDDDLLELIYKTPFAGIYNGFLGKSKVKRRRGQLLYAHMIKRYNPDFGKYDLERGYKPDDLLRPSPFNYLYILRGVLKQKKYMKKVGGDDTFNSGVWSIPAIDEIIRNENFVLIRDGFSDAFENREFMKDKLKFTHLASVERYLKTIL